jgi:importin subunit alpha-1
MENPGEAAAANALAASLAAQATVGEGDATSSLARDTAGAEEEEHELCAICSTTPRCVILTACGHCATCEACHGEVMTRSAKCVLCNLPILDGGVRVLALDASAGVPLAPMQTYLPETIDAAAAERAHAAVNAPRMPTAQQLQQLHELAAVLAVEGNDADVLLQATRDLRRMLNLHANDALLEVLLPAALHEDVPLHMVRLLERQDDGLLDLHMEAARMLRCITVGAGGADAVVDAGAVPHLIRFAASPNAEMQDKALVVLGRIAGDGPRCRDRLHSIGVVAPLLALLEADAPASLACTRRLLWVLRNLCRGKPQPPFEAVKPALPALARLVHSEDDVDVLKHACWALASLSDSTSDKIAAVLEADVCGRLVELMAHPNLDVIVPALRAVGNLMFVASRYCALVTGFDKQTQVVLDHGVLPHLLRLLMNPYKNRIKKEACWTISNITAGNKDQIQEVLDANLVPPLIQLLDTAEFDIKREAAWALINATTGGTPAQIRYLVGQGCIKPMCDLLTCSEPRVVILALEALENILEVGAFDCDEAGCSVNKYAALVDEAEGLEKIKALRHDTSKDVREKALKLLETFFGSS